MRKRQKKIIIIAGPNGAGKTTFAQEFLVGEANCPDFINADLIARGLSPFDPENAAIQAGKIMLDQMARKVTRGESFAFETTLAGRNYVRHIRNWQRAGRSRQPRGACRSRRRRSKAIPFRSDELSRHLFGDC
jgi:predicted ABC-type ATPase